MQPDPSNSTNSWDKYWQGARFSHAYSDSGVTHPEIQNYWQFTFRQFANEQSDSRIIDIASGNGALLELAQEAMPDSLASITCVDISKAAIEVIRSRFPEIICHVADATEIPEADSSFNLVTSQFGIEYAGITAINEACRILAPQGRLHLMMHLEDGAIYQECSNNLAAIQQVQESEFVPRAREMFRHGFAAVRGEDHQPYEDAASALAQSLPSVEQTMSEFGIEIASGTIGKLYNDVASIHERIQHYEPFDVLNWLDNMEKELAAYADRMRSMMDAALSSDAINEVCRILEKCDLTISLNQPLQVKDNDRALAWIIEATKSN